MIERLRRPGGTLGTLSVVCFFALAILGIVGAVAMVVSLALDSNFWSDNSGDKVGALVFFLLAVAGAYGFLVMDRLPWVGAALAVLGGLAIALVLFWAILPIVIGVGAAAVAVLRARALHHGTRSAPFAA